MLLQLKRIKSLVEFMVFNTKWVLNTFYFGLMALLCMFAFDTMREIIGVLRHDKLTVEILMEFLDKTMIANLVRMVITGSYHSFVNKNHGIPNESISGGMLKVKLSSSLLMIASVHTLKKFLESTSVNEQALFISLFIAVAIAMVFIEYMHVKIEAVEHKIPTTKGHGNENH